MGGGGEVMAGQGTRQVLLMRLIMLISMYITCPVEGGLSTSRQETLCLWL